MSGPADPPSAEPQDGPHDGLQDGRNVVGTPGAAPGPAGGGVLAFGVFELDVRAGELRRKGVRVHVQGQPLKLLELLAGSGGRLVTREEIRDHLWEPETHVEVDAGINACIRQVRTALGDSATSPRFLETVPRRGYRFLAPVRSVAPDLAPEDAPARAPADAPAGAPAGTPTGAGTPRPPLQASRPSPWAAGATGALVVVLLLAAGWLLADRWQRPEAEPAADPVTNPERPVLVVLPFENLGGAQGPPDPADDALAAGMTEELIAQIGGRYPRHLAVIARTSAMTYQGTTKTIPEIARELGADYLLESSIRSDGQRLRITAQLIDAADQSHLWAETYERTAEGLLDLQREISARIASSIGRELAPAAPRQDADAPPDAYLAYLRGRAAAEERTLEGTQRAEALFREAIAAAPRFAAAHSALGEALNAYHPTGRPDARAEARLQAERALELDPALAEAHLLRFRLLFYADYDLVAAKEAVDRALDLHPDYSEALHQLAGWYSATGRHRQALATIRRAQELDPLSMAVRSDAALYEYFAGHPRQALEMALQAHALRPGFYWAGHTVALVLSTPADGTVQPAAEAILARARSEEAWLTAYGAPLPEILNLPPEPYGDLPYEDLPRAYWEQQLRELAASAERQRPYPDVEAVALMALGRTDEALGKLRDTFEIELGWMPVFLKVHPLFRSAAEDPRFQALVGRVRWPEEAGASAP